MKSCLESSAYQDAFKARGMGIHATCPSYGMVDETMEHAFFFCPRVVQVWRVASLPFADGPTEQSTHSFLEAIRMNSYLMLLGGPALGRPILLTKFC